MSIDRITQQQRRPGSVPSIRVLVFAVVLSAFMLAGTLVGLAAAAALVMTGDVEGRFTKAMAGMTASAARLALPVHGQSLRACAHERDSYDGEAEVWLAGRLLLSSCRAGVPAADSFPTRCSSGTRVTTM
jgi:hypothetical protein